MDVHTDVSLPRWAWGIFTTLFGILFVGGISWTSYVTLNLHQQTAQLEVIKSRVNVAADQLSERTKEEKSMLAIIREEQMKRVEASAKLDTKISTLEQRLAAIEQGFIQLLKQQPRP